MFRWVIALGGLLAPLGASALEIHGAERCPSERQLRAALAQRAPHADGELSLARTGDEVQVAWHTGARQFSRALRLSPGDCPAAAETVALLVGAWQRSLPTQAEPDPLEQAAKVKAGNGDRGTGNGAPQAIPALELPALTPELPSITPPIPEAPDAGSTPATIAAPIDAGPIVTIADAGPPLAPPSPDAGPVVAMAEPLVEVGRAAPEPEPKPAPSPWHLGAALDGRGSKGIGQSRVQAGGALSLELGRGERLAVQVVGALETPQSGELAASKDGLTGSGHVSASRQTLALEGMIRFRPISSHPSGALQLHAGPMVERLGVSVDPGNTFTEAVPSQSVYAPGVAAGAAWEEAVGPLELTAGPEFELLPNPAALTVSGAPSGTFNLPPAWAGLAAGVRVHFF